MGKFTPGPWHIAGALLDFVADSHHMTICRMNETVSMCSDGKTRSDGLHSWDANASLIAAAPALLAACEAALKEWYVGDDDENREVASAAQELLSSAISQAKGGA